MSVLRAVIGGIVGLLVGYFAAAFLSGIVMGWLGVSDFEGGRGMAAVFAFGPLGGLLGLAGGIWLGLRRGGKQPVGKALGRAGGAVEWRTVDFVGVPGQPQAAKPGPEDPFVLRYKVRVWGSE